MVKVCESNLPNKTHTASVRVSARVCVCVRECVHTWYMCACVQRMQGSHSGPVSVTSPLKQ